MSCKPRQKAAASPSYPPHHSSKLSSFLQRHFSIHPCAQDEHSRLGPDPRPGESSIDFAYLAVGDTVANWTFAYSQPRPRQREPSPSDQAANTTSPHRYPRPLPSQSDFSAARPRKTAPSSPPGTSTPSPLYGRKSSHGKGATLKSPVARRVKM